MSEFKKTVTFTPAWDKRNADPKKNYGIAAVRITFVLQGELGATQFQIGTDWYLPQNQAETKRTSTDFDFGRPKPMGWDIGYHSYKRMYKSQTPMESCDILGCPCYYDGSSLQADDFIPKFLAGGSDAVWKMLEERYNDLFLEPKEQGDE